MPSWAVARSLLFACSPSALTCAVQRRPCTSHSPLATSTHPPPIPWPTHPSASGRPGHPACRQSGSWWHRRGRACHPSLDSHPIPQRWRACRRPHAGLRAGGVGRQGKEGRVSRAPQVGKGRQGRQAGRGRLCRALRLTRRHGVAGHVVPNDEPMACGAVDLKTSPIPRRLASPLLLLLNDPDALPAAKHARVPGPVPFEARRAEARLHKGHLRQLGWEREWALAKRRRTGSSVTHNGNHLFTM